EMSYVYLGPGTNPGTLKYEVTLKMYRDCNAPATSAQLDNFVTFTVFNTVTFAQIINIQNITGSPIQRIQKTPTDPCIDNNIESLVCFDFRTYTTIIDNLPAIAGGYTVTYQRCCRIAGMSNIISANVGSTYFAKIPGNFINGAETNTSPVFKTKDTVLICSARPFNFDFSATDADTDSLVYSFYNAFTGGSLAVIIPDPATAPPYQPVTYINGYTASSPLGTLVNININTGLISGTAPNVGAMGNEIFAITVLVSEYRNSVKIGEHYKDLQIRIVDCQIPTASLSPTFTTCDGFTLSFVNSAANNPEPTYLWDFGDPVSGTNNTSLLPNPTHTFTVAGDYNVKLILNQGLSCGDSATQIVHVYPGFLPGFITAPTLCINQPVLFTDTSYTAYGVVNSWRWNFGDLTTLADTSHLKMSTYTYAQSGTYTVELKVTNSKGCEKTITKSVVVSDPPIVDIFPADTAYCGLDSLQLTGIGTGSFNWLPNTNIIGANTATPIVFPSGTTKYYATLTNFAGCSSKDSITVTPKLDLSTAFTGPSPICEEDTITLTGSSNYAPNVNWQWNPAATVESPANGTTRVFPTVTTNYTLTTTWGKHCVATASKIITVKPLAIANAGPSPAICGGQQSAQLNASGGNTYTWTPATGLSNPNIANPVASPTTTTIYTVAVGVTGCPKTRDDSLIVNVRPLPALTLINDTLICNIDTLQLTTTGTGNYNWSPNYMISSTTVSSPMVSPDVPTKYFVSLTDAFGCRSNDTVFVDVKDHVTLFAGNDTTICRTDGFFLNTLSDALHYKWTPATYLDNDTVKRPFAIPLATTTYRVTANIGKCQSQDDITIKVVPYPIANAGLDTAICPGFSVQIHASGGSSYLWTPATFLNNRNIQDPVSIKPTANIRYIVAVIDTLGCSKPVRDTVWVNVYPKVIANAGPRDTSVVISEPLLLRATGGVSYLWTPATWLNNPLISNPVALPQTNIEYVVTATSAGGCIGTDTIMVHLFKVDPDMYVPTAFTPNGDGNNDVLRPILLGMKELRYFRVYNRFGNLVFSTTDIGKGWNGIYGGKGQDTATFVWMAEGVTYKGEVKIKKGYAVLIRE
ncbi:MAG: PKD domain-containing protein, partial [Ferruginibacter sp.]